MKTSNLQHTANKNFGNFNSHFPSTYFSSTYYSFRLMQIALSIFQPNKIAYFCDRLHIASIDTLSFHLNPSLFQAKNFLFTL